MKNPAVPQIRTGRPDMDNAMLIVKQKLDRITGNDRSSEELGRLPAGATTAQIIAFLNRIADRLEPL